MLQHLHVKNIALIDEVDIDFGENLNVMTGETGAGKSIIIDSITYAMGEKYNKDVIRTGEEQALVELLFNVKNSTIIKTVEEMGIEIDSTGDLLISRSLSRNGRGVSRVNGKTVTNGMLQVITKNLVDIHGQNQHHSLLDDKKHLELLDQFFPQEVQTLKEELNELIQEKNQLFKKYKEAKIDESEKSKRIDLLEFQLKDIEDAKLEEDEYEELLEKRKVLLNAQKLLDGVSRIYAILQEPLDSSHLSVIDEIGESIQILGQLVKYDKELNNTLDALESANNIIIDVSREVHDYFDGMNHDPENLFDIEKRIDRINNLKKKYGNTIEEILKYRTNIENELDRLQNNEIYLKKITTELNQINSKIQKICEKLSAFRREKAKIVQEEMERVLHSLQLENAEFRIQIQKSNEPTRNGYDDVLFMISTNIGEPQKPLSQIVSGGESSRIMLAMKTVLADADQIPSLIFDEIDAGISGRAAQKVSEKLSYLSKNHQIICITHLPQIGAMADCHFLIEKKNASNKTNTYIYQIKGDQKVKELARLIGGAVITETTLNSAKEMIQMAIQIKKLL